MRLACARYHRPSGLSGVEILSCPDSGADFPEHLHDTLTLWVNDRGGEYLRHRGCTTILQPGSFGLINAGEVHANGYAGGIGRHLRTIYVDEDTASGLLDPGSWRGTDWPDGLHHAPMLHERLLALHHVLSLSPSPLECAQAMIETMALLARHFRRSTRPAPARESKRLTLIRAVLHDRSSEQLHLNDLAQRAGCTPTHLIRIFRQGTGLSPHAYLVRVRVAKAKRLLGQGRTPLDAALATGFADQAHLTRWFRSLTGVTPAAYRRAILTTSYEGFHDHLVTNP